MNRNGSQSIQTGYTITPAYKQFHMWKNISGVWKRVNTSLLKVLTWSRRIKFVSQRKLSYVIRRPVTRLQTQKNSTAKKANQISSGKHALPKYIHFDANSQNFGAFTSYLWITEQKQNIFDKHHWKKTYCIQGGHENCIFPAYHNLFCSSKPISTTQCLILRGKQIFHHRWEVKNLILCFDQMSIVFHSGSKQKDFSPSTASGIIPTDPTVPAVKVYGNGSLGFVKGKTHIQYKKSSLVVETCWSSNCLICREENKFHDLMYSLICELGIFARTHQSAYLSFRTLFSRQAWWSLKKARKKIKTLRCYVIYITR